MKAMPDVTTGREPAHRDHTTAIPDQAQRAAAPDQSRRSPDQPGDRSRPALDTGPDRSATVPQRRGAVRSWPVLILAAPAATAVWSGWVSIGQMTGFGQIRPLPGIWDTLHIDTAVTLPVGVEAYAAFALRAWLSSSPAVSGRTRRFARRSSITALALGMAGQVAYHLLTQAGMTRAPWEVTTLVSCLPVLVLGMGTALAHLLRSDAPDAEKNGDATAELLSAMRASESGMTMTYRRCGEIARGPFPGRHPAVAAAGRGPAWSRRAGGGNRPGTAGTHGITSRGDGHGRPPARMRIAEAQAAAAKVTASGERVSRRSLRAAGLRGSNADLGMLARLIGPESPAGEPRAAP